MELEAMLILARRSRECAKRAHEEEAFWQRLIAQRLQEEQHLPDQDVVA